MKWWGLFILCLAAACTSNTSPEDANSENDTTTGVHAGATDTIIRSQIALQEGCYTVIRKGDTATLDLQIQDSVITGQLNYRWAEKDNNSGTIWGIVRDSLLIADYTFQSEGLSSVREVVFKLKGDTLLQGYGELTEQGNKVLFKEKDRLQYDTSFPFIKVDCQMLRR